MPRHKSLKRGTGWAVYLSHDEWEKYSDYSGWATFLAGLVGFASPIALVLATVGAPYFLLANYKEKKWGRRGIVFKWEEIRPNNGDFPTFHNPDIWDELTSEYWEET